MNRNKTNDYQDFLLSKEPENCKIDDPLEMLIRNFPGWEKVNRKLLSLKKTPEFKNISIKRWHLILLWILRNARKEKYTFPLKNLKNFLEKNDEGVDADKPFRKLDEILREIFADTLGIEERSVDTRLKDSWIISAELKEYLKPYPPLGISISKSRRSTERKLFKKEAISGDQISRRAEVIPPTLRQEVISYLKDLEKYLVQIPLYYPDGLNFDTVKIPINIRELGDPIPRDHSIASPSRYELNPLDIFDFRLPDRIIGFEKRISREVDVCEWDEHTRIGKSKRHVILADPGMGKTFLLRHECLKIARDSMKKLSQSNEEIVFPVFLSLPNIAGYLKDHQDASFEDALVAKLSDRFSKKGFSKEFNSYVRIKLDSSRSRLLFDALDEVPDDDRVLIRERIHDFSEKYSQCSIILTSRKAEYFSPSPIRGAEEFELLPLNMRQIKDFVTLWFSADKSQHVNISRKKMQNILLELRRKPLTYMMCQNPLFLSLLCKSWKEENIASPHNKAELYYEILYGLLVRWHRQKFGKPPERSIVRDKLAVLEFLGWKLFQENKEEIRQEELDLCIQGFLKSEEIPLPGLEGWKSRALRKEFIRDGILIETGKPGSNSYSFIHRNFRDYFVASFIARNKEHFENVKKQSWSSPKWRPVITLLGGFCQGQPPSSDLIRSPVDTDVVFDPLELLEIILYSSTNPDDIFSSMLTIAAEFMGELPPHLRKTDTCKKIEDRISSEKENPQKIFLFETKAKLAVFSKSFQQIQSVIEELYSSVYFAISVNAKERARIFARILFAEHETRTLEMEREAIEFLRKSDIDGRKGFSVFMLGEIAVSRPESAGKIIEELIELLKHHEKAVRYEAAEALGEIAAVYPENMEVIVPHLVQSIRDEDLQIQEIVRSEAKRLGSYDFLEEWLYLPISMGHCFICTEESLNLSRNCIKIGFGIKDSERESYLFMPRRFAYNLILGNIVDSLYGPSKGLMTIITSSPESKKFLFPDIEKLVGEEWGVRWETFKIMRNFFFEFQETGLELLPYMKRGLRDPYCSVHCVSAQTLSDIAIRFPDKVDEICEFLIKSYEDLKQYGESFKTIIYSDMTPYSGYTVPNALEEIAIKYPSKAEKIVIALISSLRNSSLYHLHWQTTLALSRISYHAAGSRPLIIQSLKDLVQDHTCVDKTEAALALIDLDKSLETMIMAAPCVRKALKDGRLMVCHVAMETMMKIGWVSLESARDCIPDILDLLADKYRHSCVPRILGAIFIAHEEVRSEIYPILLQSLSAEGQISDAAAETLGKIAIEIPEFAPEIVLLLRKNLHRNEKIHIGAATALMKIYLSDSEKSAEISLLLRELSLCEQDSIPLGIVKMIENGNHDMVEDMIRVLLEALHRRDTRVNDDVLELLAEICAKHKVKIIENEKRHITMSDSERVSCYTTKSGASYSIIRVE